MAARRKSTRKTSSKKSVSSSATKSSDKRTSSDKTIFLLAVALVVAIGGYLFLTGKAQAPAPVAKMATVALDAQNKSGEAGIATIKEMGGKVLVTIDITGAPAGVTQPAHIHAGSCPSPGAVEYPLTSPVDGKSETTLDVSFDDLMKKLPLAVNVHKSVAMSKVYVACGNVTAPAY